MTIGFGRYVLDRAGRLHPLRRRYWVDAVAVVNVRPIAAAKKCRPQDIPTADSASGCEGRAADSTCQSRPAAVRAAKPELITPVNARQSRTLPERPTASLLEADRAIPPRVTKPVTPAAPPRPKPPLIDLSTAPSSLEQRAASWRGNT